MEASDDVRSPEKAYERLPKLGRLDHKGRAVAMRLAIWRDEIARELDRPPASVLPDQVLVELAKRTPKDRAGAGQHPRPAPADPAPARRRAGGADRPGREEEPPPPPPTPPKRDSSEAPLVSLAQAVVRQRSRETGVATS